MIFTEPDVLDRSIMIELERIRDENQLTEEEIFREFEQQLPQLWGYIFDTISKALIIKDTLNLEKLPRMSDFVVWGRGNFKSCRLFTTHIS